MIFFVATTICLPMTKWAAPPQRGGNLARDDAALTHRMHVVAPVVRGVSVVERLDSGLAGARSECARLTGLAVEDGDVMKRHDAEAVGLVPPTGSRRS